jgi:hypothetical protein
VKIIVVYCKVRSSLVLCWGNSSKIFMVARNWPGLHARAEDGCQTACSALIRHHVPKCPKNSFFQLTTNECVDAYSLERHAGVGLVEPVDFFSLSDSSKVGAHKCCGLKKMMRNPGPS